MIDEKNLNVYVRDYSDAIKKRQDCFGFFIAFVSVTLTLLTATFHDFGLSASVWNALFILVDLFLLYMTAKSAFYLLKTKNISPDQLISQIKKQAEAGEEISVGMTEF